MIKIDIYKGEELLWTFIFDSEISDGQVSNECVDDTGVGEWPHTDVLTITMYKVGKVEVEFSYRY